MPVFGAVGLMGKDLEAPVSDDRSGYVHLRDAIEALPEAVAVFDEGGRFVLWNRRFAEIYAGEGLELHGGLSFEEHLRRSVALGRVADAVGREDAWIKERLARFYSADGAHDHQLADGHWMRVQDRKLPHGGRVGIRADITDLLRMEGEVRRSREFLRTVLDHIPTAVFVKDMRDGGRYILCNRSTEAVYRRSSLGVLGATDRDILSPGEAERIADSDQAALRLGSAGTVDEEMLRQADGSERLIRTRKVAFSEDATSAPRYVLGIAEDVTEQRASEARIAFMAHHDALTELPNRYLFRDRLESALTRLQGTSELLAVLLVDLDGFKSVNDSWGHAAGDALLQAVAERMLACLRRTDTVARLGGDEFAILLAPLNQIGEAAWLATRLIGQLAASFSVGGRQLKTSASIGISIAPRGGTEPGELLSRADSALYQAKREGRNRFRFADQSLNTHAEERRTSGAA